MKGRMVKQCSYCHRVLAEDGEYHDIGLSGPIDGVFVGTPRLEKIRIVLGLCSDCYESRVGKTDGAGEGAPPAEKTEFRPKTGAD